MFKKIFHAVGLKHASHKAELMTQGDYDFMAYVTEYGKSYGTKAEFEFRSNLFKLNQKHVTDHNAKFAAGEETHELEMNHMSDWTDAEYRRLLGYKPSLRTGGLKAPKILPTHNLADGVDWVASGAVTKVKNQGQCGSCWAFSTTGSIEGAEFLFGTKTLTSLSEQQLVDCSKENDGCNGGLMDTAFEFVEKTPLVTEEEYPYKGKAGKCKKEGKGVGHVKAFEDVDEGVDQLKAAVMKGPVSIAVEADKAVFQNYKRGVITSKRCGKKLDHGVLAVGYGTDPVHGEYFKVKNSWGASWGDKGYLEIAASPANICGILSQPSYPTE